MGQSATASSLAWWAHDENLTFQVCLRGPERDACLVSLSDRSGQQLRLLLGEDAVVVTASRGPDKRICALKCFASGVLGRDCPGLEARTKRREKRRYWSRRPPK